MAVFKATINLTLYGWGQVSQNEVVDIPAAVVADPRNSGILGTYLLPQQPDGSFADPTPQPTGCCGTR